MSTTADNLPAAPPRGLWPTFKGLFRSPAFVVATLVLFAAAVGLNWATQSMQLYFKKLPVPLARPIDQVPEKLGRWVQVSHDEPLDKEIQDVLGTQLFIFRDYVLEDAQTKADIRLFADKPTKERRERLAALQTRLPDHVINLAVTYYTGLVDTVAHIPDRCYIADGYQPAQYEEPVWKVKNKDGQDFDLKARYINFEDQTGTSRVTKRVAYFFNVNGRYESDPLAVRRSLQNLFRKHGYYAKVELMTIIRDGNRSAAVMTDFLRSALPEIEKCLPDWNAVEGGK